MKRQTQDGGMTWAFISLLSAVLAGYPYPVKRGGKEKNRS